MPTDNILHAHRLGRRWRADRICRGLAVIALLAASILLASSAAAGAQQDDGGWVIRSFVADITVRDDGALEVREEITVDFGELERRGIFRVIPVRYTVAPGDPNLPAGVRAEDVYRVLRIDDIRVHSATAPADLETSTEDGDLVLRIGDEDTTIIGAHTYELAYRVEGALNRNADGNPTLTWDVTGHGWPVPIETVDARIDAPAVDAAVCARGTPGSTEPCARVQAGERGALAADGPLEPGEGLTISVTFPQDAVAVPPPLLRERWRLGNALFGSAAALPLTAVTTVVTAVGVTLLARRGRDERTTGTAPATPGLALTPPDGLRPAQLAVLLDERVDAADLAATLLDLAGRGLLTVEHVGEDDGDWVLRRGDERSSADLLAFERHLLDALFADDDRVVLSDLHGEFHDHYRTFQQLVEADAVARGWFPRPPSATRARWLGIAIASTVGAIGLLVLALVFTSIAAAAVPLLIGALALLGIHAEMPHRTAEGVRLLRHARNFRTFLRSGAAGFPEAAADPRAAFAQFLPYAVGFGVVPELVTRFTRLGVPEEAWVPAWYYGLWHGDPSRMTSDLADFAKQVDGGLTTAPAPSSSGVSGVSSGGGFGGGGGGSW